MKLYGQLHIEFNYDESKILHHLYIYTQFGYFIYI